MRYGFCYVTFLGHLFCIRFRFFIFWIALRESAIRPCNDESVADCFNKSKSFALNHNLFNFIVLFD